MIEGVRSHHTSCGELLSLLRVAASSNNQRDGFHQHQIFRGRVSYEPNSLAGGCPFQAGAAGFVSYAEKLAEASRMAEPTKLRAKPQKFAEHYAQARLFWRSQTPIEQQHIVDAFRFELTRVQTAAVRERVVAQLRNVDAQLAQKVARGLGMEALPEPLPVLVTVPRGEVDVSRGLSLLARPGEDPIRTRCIALLVTDGMDTAAAAQLYDLLTLAGGLPRYVGARLGKARGIDGSMLPIEVTFEAMPAVLWDAMVLPAGAQANALLAQDDLVVEFLMLHWRHNKAILAPQSAEPIFKASGIRFGDHLADIGVLVPSDTEVTAVADRFIDLVGRHRVYERFTGNAMLPVGAEPPSASGSARGADAATSSS
jgi:catalase